MYHHLCLPTDGSPLSAHAIEQGLALARQLHARVTVVHVIQPYRVYAVSPEQLALGGEAEYRHAVQELSRQLLHSVKESAQTLSVRCDTVVVEDELPWQAIIAVAKERSCDLIAMASHGHRGIKALLLGSETLKVLTHSTLPVLVYRHPA